MHCMKSLQELCRSIFRAVNEDGEMPLLEARLRIMYDHLATLLHGFTNCIKFTKDTMEFLIPLSHKLINCSLPCFSPVVTYKRAQILTTGLWLVFKGKSYGRFSDIDYLTVFAYYRLDISGEHLNSDSVWGVEIRGACLQAIEILVQRTWELLC
ncbi:Queuosine salvage protein [Taenia crassiceps]|uniref:Queuosine 5'-phosphate N-glycosylase/hydrolase n=1 Tax=Taenia crassiceps TaxID=6207 RepID=A0ABR4QII7_9CEST